jgi:hypothetical protein
MLQIAPGLAVHPQHTLAELGFLARYLLDHKTGLMMHWISVVNMVAYPIPCDSHRGHAL